MWQIDCTINLLLSVISLCWLLFIPHEELLLLTSAENGPEIDPGVMDIMDCNTPVFL